MGKLQDRVAIVTGGSTGIGRGTALAFANEGARVLITGRSESTLKESANQHNNISYLIADASSPEDAAKTIKYVEENFGGLDILVNNAGIALFIPLEFHSIEQFDLQFNTNVRGLFEITRVALPLLEKSKGVILSTSSGVVDAPLANASAYAATKAAVITLSKCWAKELAPKGIRVNVVSPGPIKTPIFDKMGMSEEQVKSMAENMASQVPLGRLGAPEDIANAFVYLASDDAKYVTGAQLVVDGGFSA